MAVMVMTVVETLVKVLVTVVVPVPSHDVAERVIVTVEAAGSELLGADADTDAGTNTAG
jgi:hypothetical protein